MFKIKLIVSFRLFFE